MQGGGVWTNAAGNLPFLWRHLSPRLRLWVKNLPLYAKEVSYSVFYLKYATMDEIQSIFLSQSGKRPRSMTIFRQLLWLIKKEKQEKMIQDCVEQEYTPSAKQAQHYSLFSVRETSLVRSPIELHCFPSELCSRYAHDWFRHISVRFREQYHRLYIRSSAQGNS